MRKSAVKTAPKRARKASPKPKKPKSVDDQLAEYLTIAEDALIAAVKLFSGPERVSRRVGYQSRLENAQEAITGLLREELVRIRGPIKKRSSK